MPPASFTISPQLNTSVIEDFFGNDTEHIQRIFTDFLAEVPLFLDHLQQAHARHDVKALKMHIHRFRPLYYYIGLTEPYQQLENFESACATVPAAEVLEPYFTKAVAYLQTSCQLIAAELQRLNEYNNASNEN